mmetsp:Transcript_2613/g.7780  ORF Transcript_2613/g.7780 Transcript_2613/m.7780 type:complete len:268 (+) Transcript_2613:2208-3011(+)
MMLLHSLPACCRGRCGRWRLPPCVPPPPMRRTWMRCWTAPPGVPAACLPGAAPHASAADCWQGRRRCRCRRSTCRAPSRRLASGPPLPLALPQCRMSGGRTWGGWRMSRRPSWILWKCLCVTPACLPPVCGSALACCCMGPQALARPCWRRRSPRSARSTSWPLRAPSSSTCILASPSARFGRSLHGRGRRGPPCCSSMSWIPWPQHAVPAPTRGGSWTGWWLSCWRRSTEPSRATGQGGSAPRACLSSVPPTALTFWTRHCSGRDA